MVAPQTLDVVAFPEKSSVVFTVRVQPGAARNQVIGPYGGALKLRIQAPAAQNRANDELCLFLAELLKRPKSAVRLLSGERSRTKRVEVFGVTAGQVQSLVVLEA